ncbi:MAG: phosphohistidine phosphatase SixA [Gemmataceae bacterium]
MDLYLIRHCEAVDRSDPNYSEEERPLTEKGRDQARALAAALVARGVSFDAVISSPLDRCRQTAEEILQHLPGPMAELTFTKHLAPGGKARKLVRYLVGIGGESVAIIGHQPDLSKFAARIMGSGKAELDIAKGGMAMLQCDAVPDKGRGTLAWLITPEWVHVPVEASANGTTGW